ncbi:hypothetical protein FLA_5791 [Filimonas lacunae]|nr:hypothetical protein FLA_5791 [Filimonas lacunae]
MYELQVKGERYIAKVFIQGTTYKSNQVWYLLYFTWYW